MKIIQTSKPGLVVLAKPIKITHCCSMSISFDNYNAITASSRLR